MGAIDIIGKPRRILNAILLFLGYMGWGGGTHEWRFLKDILHNPVGTPDASVPDAVRCGNGDTRIGCPEWRFLKGLFA